MKDTMLIFDLDGTLWDSGCEVAESWNIVLQAHDPGLKTLTAEDMHAVMGKTMDEIAAIILPDMDEVQRAPLFKECERFEIEYIAEHGGTLFPKVRETLERLKEEGFDLAIVSNCQTGYINAFYQSMNMQKYFCDMEEWGRTGRPKSENIRLVMNRNGYEKAVYIGDTVKDQQAAMDAGIPFIHAAYGFGTAASEAAVINKFEDLPGCVAKVMGNQN
ncbi:MAG: HAD family hydrolase [Parasporobacterium sp.]|nr:HAD family hydrolase [Parasporobacterium sp.]